MLAPCLLLLAHSLAAQESLVFDFTRAGESNQWAYYNESTRVSPASMGGNGRPLVLDCANDTYLMRPVVFDASQFNRMTVNATLQPDSTSAGGFVIATAYFAGETGQVLPENYVGIHVPTGRQISLELHLDQALAWSGPIRVIRLNPMRVPGRAEIHRITLHYEEPERIAPSWEFNDSRVASQWYFGEHVPGAPTDDGRPRRDFELRQARVDPIDGVQWTIQNDIPGIYSRQFNYHSASIRDVEIEFRYAQHRPVAADQSRLIFYWSSGGNFTPDQQVMVPISPGNDWQRITIPVNEHARWQGPLAGLRVDFHIGPGTVSLRRISCGTAGALDALTGTSRRLDWISVDDIGGIIERDYRPLLVLVDDPAVAYCQKIERQLASNTEFINLMGHFYSVRARHDDPRVRNAVPNIYRVPTLVFLKYDFHRGTWYEAARLAGPEVPEQVVAAQQFVLR